MMANIAKNLKSILDFPEEGSFKGRFPYLLLLGLFFGNLVIVLRNAVNIPVFDEWDLLLPGHFILDPSLKNLFSLHNEHRVVLTKALTWLSLKWNDWDISAGVGVSWLVFGLVVYALLRVLKKLSSSEVWIGVWFFPFLFSNLPHENHGWSFCSQFHFFILFFILSTLWLFRPKLTLREGLIGVACATLANFSFSAGAACTGSLVASFILMRLLTGSNLRDGFKNLMAREAIVVVVGLIVSVLLWRIGWEKNPGHPPYTFPFEMSYWHYFVNVLSLGFGLIGLSSPLGFACLAWTVIPLSIGLLSPELRKKSEFWMVFALIFGVLASLGVISLGRAGFGVAQAKSSRYSEISMLLVPLSVMAWLLALRAIERLRAPVVGVFLVLIFASYFDKWSEEPYVAQYKRNSEGVECVRAYYDSKGNGLCPQIFPISIVGQLNEAKRLKLSFYQEYLASKGLQAKVTP